MIFLCALSLWGRGTEKSAHCPRCKIAFAFPTYAVAYLPAVTPVPTASTVPAISWPGTRGNWIPGKPFLLCVQITGASATGLDTQAHLTSPWRGHRLGCHLDNTAGMGKLGRTHGVLRSACSAGRGAWLWGSQSYHCSFCGRVVGSAFNIERKMVIADKWKREMPWAFLLQVRIR